MHRKRSLHSPMCRSIIVNRKENAATRAAALVIPTVGNNRERHERLQQFMLANDSVTLAVEVPIWLTENDIAALEEKSGIELVPRSGTVDRVVTGHMDFLQVRNGAVHIWTTNRTRARTNPSRSSRSTRSRSRASCRVSRSSTSSARGSTRTSTASLSRARCSHRKEGDDFRHPLVHVSPRLRAGSRAIFGSINRMP